MSVQDGAFAWQPQEKATAKICNLFTEFQNHGTNQSQVRPVDLTVPARILCSLVPKSALSDPLKCDFRCLPSWSDAVRSRISTTTLRLFWRKAVASSWR